MKIKLVLLTSGLLFASSTLYAENDLATPFAVFSAIHFNIMNETGAAIPTFGFAGGLNVSPALIPALLPVGNTSFTDTLPVLDPQLHTWVQYMADDGPSSHPTGALFFGAKLVTNKSHIPHSTCKTYGDMAGLVCTTHGYITYNPTVYNVDVTISK